MQCARARWVNCTALPPAHKCKTPFFYLLAIHFWLLHHPTTLLGDTEEHEQNTTSNHPALSGPPSQILFGHFTGTQGTYNISLACLSVKINSNSIWPSSGGNTGKHCQSQTLLNFLASIPFKAHIQEIPRQLSELETDSYFTQCL